MSQLVQIGEGDIAVRWKVATPLALTIRDCPPMNLDPGDVLEVLTSSADPWIESSIWPAVYRGDLTPVEITG